MPLKLNRMLKPGAMRELTRQVETMEISEEQRSEGIIADEWIKAGKRKDKMQAR